MPSLAGLFGRKKSSSKQQGNSHETDSALSSPTADYVTPDRSLPSSPNGRSGLRYNATHASSSVYPSLAAPPSKLRLPFSRKKASAAASTTSVITTDTNLGSPPRPSYLTPRNSTSAASESDVDSRRLRPPPSKSAIFAAYGDPHSSLSTRSLPTEHSPLTITISNSSAPPPIPPPVPPKKPGFFHWSKSSPSSPQTSHRKPKISTSPPQLSPTTPVSDFNNSSFNLKSFRHVVPTHPSPSPNASNTSLPPAIPRPRGMSVASESSQRISVAAFREAQARRSTAGSPVPSNRAPSPGPMSNYSTRPHQQQAPAVPQKQVQKRRSSGLAYTSASDSDESESSDEEDVDSDVSPPPRGSAGIVRRKRTVTKRGAELDVPTIKGRATKSEAGHGSSAHNRDSDFAPGSRSQSGHHLMSQYPGRSAGQHVDDADRSGSSNAGARPRASMSTSALTPSAAAKRASIIATANAIPLPNSNGKHHTRASSATSISIPASAPAHPTHTRRPAATSHSSSDSDSDDAPLATLLPPRRPGSALSSSTTSHSSTARTRVAPKPLIDINALTSGRPQPAKTSATDADAFTPGATLLGRGVVASPKEVSPVAVPAVTSVSPPTRFVSPPSSPKREAKRLAVEPVQQQQQQLRSSAGGPMRRETSPGGEEVRTERGGLGERLTRVVQLKTGSGSGSGMGSGSSGGSTSTSGSVGSSVGPRTAKPVPAPAPAPKPTTMTNIGPPEEEEEDLAAMLGAGIHLIRRTGDSASDSESASSKSESESESDSDDDDGYPKSKVQQKDKKKGQKEPDRIAPIPIKERPPPPAFSVTSRPPLNRGSGGSGSGDRSSVVSLQGQGARQRSSTLVPSSSASAFGATTAKPNGKLGILNAPSGGSGGVQEWKAPTPTPTQGSRTVAPAPRQRSSTLLPSSMSSSAVSAGVGNVNVVPLPSRPFAAARRESPASSTGDSSSGRAPVTPKDGSDLGVGSVTGTEGSVWSGGVSGLAVGMKGKHIKRRSVSFEEDLRDLTTRGKGGREVETPGEGEERRRERRRGEAKAAIELGNVINGRGPLVADDDEDDLPINQTLGGGARMSTLNPLMAMGGFGPAAAGWNGMNMNMNMNMPMNANMNMNPGMLAPGQFLPPGADPNFVAAHQQAMMYAKQAYQMAVAQQAMAAAGDEWERGSTVGGYGGGGGSVYGGTSPSIVGSPYAMSPMMNMGMGMGMQSPGNGWSTGSVIFPGPARSMYGGMSGARSDYGGGGGGGGQWSTSKSSYGESFGPSSNRNSRVGAGQGRPVYGQRDSGYFPPVPPIPPQTGASSGKGGASAPRSRTASQPASPSRGVRKVPPPSSWKAGA